MTKTELRREARRRMASQTPEDRLLRGRAIMERLLAEPEIAAARSILLYSSLPEEVPTELIAEDAWRRGVIVTYPRCLPETREMTIHEVAELSMLEADAYGIPAPGAACPLIGVGEIDVAIVPGLAWDRTGGRLGRGAGYYDRLLGHPEFRGLRCGVFFATQEMEAIPMERWDVRLDLIVTEAETLRTR
jgi:5-formyltetrahydrofolate cyclo-ligase